MRKFFINIFIVIGITLIGFSPILYFNLCEDPYSIFRTDFSKVRIEPNNHFIKMRYILNDKTKFDSFIFGSSRANNVKPQQFKNGNYFNMYYSLGIPEEHLEDIRMMIKHKIQIKNILILLDFTSYSTSTKGRENDLLRRHYSDEKMVLLKKYIKYAFVIPDWDFVDQYFQQNVDSFYKNTYKSGTAENEIKENYIEKNKVEHINSSIFNEPIVSWESHVLETVATLDTIKKLCEANHISLTLAMNPIHKATYLANSPGDYFAFLKRLSEISSFYDFSGLNRITTNNYFYYETSHFRPMIGNAMANFIQYGKHIDTIPEFGIYITKNNIDERINFLQSQIPQK